MDSRPSRRTQAVSSRRSFRRLLHPLDQFPRSETRISVDTSWPREPILTSRRIPLFSRWRSHNL